MPLSNAVKKNALTLLKNKWVYALAITFMPLLSFTATLIETDLLTNFFPLYVTLPFFILVTVFVTSPVMLGALRVFILLYDDEQTTLQDTFYYFSGFENYKKAMSFYFNYYLQLLAAGIILCLPAIILDVIYKGYVFELINVPVPMWSTSIGFIVKLLYVLAFAFLFFYSMRYFVSAFIMVKTEDAKKSIALSKQVMKMTAFSVMEHIVSFIGWIVLSLLFLPLIATLPYFVSAYTVDCNFCLNYYYEQINKTNCPETD